MWQVFKSGAVEAHVLVANLPQTEGIKSWLCPVVSKSLPTFKNNMDSKRKAGLDDSTAQVLVRPADLGELGSVFKKRTSSVTFYQADKAMEYVQRLKCGCDRSSGTKCDFCIVVMTA
jgi:hypothetical protein